MERVGILQVWVLGFFRLAQWPVLGWSSRYMDITLLWSLSRVFWLQRRKQTIPCILSGHWYPSFIFGGSFSGLGSFYCPTCPSVHNWTFGDPSEDLCSSSSIPLIFPSAPEHQRMDRQGGAMVRYQNLGEVGSSTGSVDPGRKAFPRKWWNLRYPSPCSLLLLAIE